MVDIYVNKSKTKNKKLHNEHKKEFERANKDQIFDKSLKKDVTNKVLSGKIKQKPDNKEKQARKKSQKNYIKDRNITQSLEQKFLSSFLYFPKDAHFSTQDPQEKIVLMLRRHFVTNIPWILVSLLLFVAPLFVFRTSAVDFVPERFQVVGFLMWYMLSMAYFYESFLSWYFQVAIITDERVVDVDFVNLIYREISAAKINQIQDVTVQMGGVVQSVFNYGDVYIQTASEKARIEYTRVPKPDTVASVLRELIIEEEQEDIEGRVR